MKTISIARDFAVTPGGRFNRDGPYSGEAFRKRFLEPAVDAGETVIVELDSVAGLPSSFLEEAFGGLFRSRPNVPAKRLREYFRIQATEPDLAPYVGLINRYMDAAAKIASRTG